MPHNFWIACNPPPLLCLRKIKIQQQKKYIWEGSHIRQVSFTNGSTPSWNIDVKYDFVSEILKLVSVKLQILVFSFNWVSRQILGLRLYHRVIAQEMVQK